ncbi:RHE_PE00001 family protein [Chelativorans salis]|uniref:RHE_PE00001 family protein n=1 Tax=Chelativorans salis TaxID=2978478 RepID=A0ABT2LXR6_9HYPH|nr:RHE_PE00001 family protein [Chelativorans sp. EGI FJ00035]MCT7377989.1 RHE_PE00001 family protein [Chelativorans sp. EGI FJ00035]
MGHDSLELSSQGLLMPLARAEDLLARLDERVARSAQGRGFSERQHFTEAAAALWLDGELVHVEDLVLHDGRMDVRAPTHEITRAHGVLRARRRIAGNRPDWALSPDGLGVLVAREGEGAPLPVMPAETPGYAEPTRGEGDQPEPLAEEFAEIDAVLARAGRALANKGTAQDVEKLATPWPLPAPTASTGFAEAGEAALGALMRDPDRDETALLGEWLALVRRAEAEALPPVMTAYLAWEAWERIDPLERQHWLGNLLVAALLRKSGKTGAHLAGLSGGLRGISRERRQSRNRATRCLAFFEALSAAAIAGAKEIDRLELAAAQMERRLKGKRRNSRLPRLAELILSRPVVSAGLIAAELKITQRAALNLIDELGVRELTGRGRYRAWGIV